MKVFISSTYVDLIEYRRKAIEVVNRYECTPLAMELFGSQPEEPKKVCDDKIRECDVFIGIYAHRYGFIPDGETKSITQLEYELAKDLKKPCLCFVVDKTSQWPFPFIEMDNYPKLEAFLEEVKKACVVESFKSPDDFTGKLATSLANLIEKLKGTPVQKDSVCLIPRAPLPYMAHPYALPEHFTGRRAEMAMLSNWFFNEKEPVLALEAIGGMGKSALSWAWLHQEIMDRAVKVDGVFWWSFYDEPFESFITQLYCYVTGKDSTQSIHMGELQSALNNRQFLLVLDGLERALRGYAGMEAMYIQEKRFAGDTQAETEWDKRMREPVDPKAGRFLQALCAGNTKTLMTTRLTPVSLEGIAGVKHVFLTGLSVEDTVSFFRNEEINGTRAEMEQAGRVYDFHPLMLKLLASSIKRSRAKDIKEAFSQNLIDQKEPHKILERSVHLLSEEERRVVVRVAVFRGVFTFNAVKALAVGMEEKRLWEVMQELRNLGFLFYDEAQDRFDFHPILRSFLYGQLTSSGETGVHDLAAQYFEALPKPEKVVTLEDLTPVIELYHHLVKSEKYDEAYELFLDRIDIPTYYQLAAYQLQIELLKELFPGGEIDGRLPLLKKKAQQASALNDMANAYALSGQPANAVPLFILHNKLREEDDDKKNLANGLGDAASKEQFQIGQLSAAAGHLRKGIALCCEIKDELWEAVGRQELGRVRAFQGNACAKEELNEAFKSFKKINNNQSMSIVSAYYSLSVLLQARLAAAPTGMENRSSKQSRKALAHALEALMSAAITNPQSTVSRNFVHSYWMLGEALMQCSMDRSSGAKHSEPLEFTIPFYDDYFQRVVEVLTISAAADSELNAAGHCLHEALRRCRTVNLVELEPDILLWPWRGSTLPKTNPRTKPSSKKLLRLPCGQAIAWYWPTSIFSAARYCCN